MMAVANLRRIERAGGRCALADGQILRRIFGGCFVRPIAFALAALDQVAELATLRNEIGVSAYLEVLDAERNLFSGQLALADFRRQRLNAVVAAYRALGGGWERGP